MKSNMSDKFLSAETIARCDSHGLSVEVMQDYKMTNPRLNAQSVFVGQDIPIFSSLAGVHNIEDLTWDYFTAIGEAEHWFLSAPVYNRISTPKEFSIEPYPLSEGNAFAGFIYIPTSLAMKLVGKDRFKKTHRGETNKLFAAELEHYNEWLAGRFYTFSLKMGDTVLESNTGNYATKTSSISDQCNALAAKWLEVKDNEAASLLKAVIDEEPTEYSESEIETETEAA